MKIKLILEFSAIFILLPLLFLLHLLPKYMIIPSLWLVSLYAYIILRVKGQVIFANSFELEDINYILKRFIVISSIIFIFTFFLYPNKLFGLIVTQPYIYLAVIIFYPLFSVIPQELLFRQFFFYRYSLNFSKFTIIWANALAFGFVHVAFGNILAVIFTILGGLLFASTYKKTECLILVIIEHSLYGVLIFTVGLGEFFYHNNGY
ncbi:CPBP family intramembrane metalloprotease [Sulfurimonas lithotrophica]|uniref:CPBP family intramembrane metalloprotease n=1 Tax=Sulfurimonas lithotrophica TaxID=2590022 RepID=A0A5P8P237_9BACT|nr:CPBP family intramembrane glutamic endopeptidase [Sulfurimonas lithotrophica]QFR49769.1 CPBP family intramembrane metalloprotease [Sulfurimonas lithotrophica]